MRGLHSTLGMEVGVTGAMVAASLGHESVSNTVESYAKPEAVAAAALREIGVRAAAKDPLETHAEQNRFKTTAGVSGRIPHRPAPFPPVELMGIEPTASRVRF
jgi:hypothetical protein